MKIVISTLGSRGDVQPYLGLAVGLQEEGHTVTLAAPQLFADWIRSYGVEAVPVRFNPQEASRKIGLTVGGLRTLPAVLKFITEGIQQAQDDSWQAALESDLLIQSSTGMGALELAALHRKPGVFAHLFPFSPTRAMPMFWLPFRFSLGGGYNLLTHQFMLRFLWRFGGKMMNDWRKRLRLQPWRSAGEATDFARGLHIPYLLGYSPALIPKPADWDQHQRVTGYWFLDEPPGWQPPEDLARFLENGPPPVYIGFGSMNYRDPVRLTRAALEALEITGRRGILQTGWGGIAQMPASGKVLFIDEAPHAWLFPQMAAVIHHGGAGTTASGLRAGVPNILVPFGGDQFSWADVIVKARVGVRINGVRRMNARNLAEAIDAATTDAGLQARAAALGETIRSENGVQKAVEIVQNYEAEFHNYRRRTPNAVSKNA